MNFVGRATMSFALMLLLAGCVSQQATSSNSRNRVLETPDKYIHAGANRHRRAGRRTAVVTGEHTLAEVGILER